VLFCAPVKRAASSGLSLVLSARTSETTEDIIDYLHLQFGTIFIAKKRQLCSPRGLALVSNVQDFALRAALTIFGITLKLEATTAKIKLKVCLGKQHNND